MDKGEKYEESIGLKEKISKKVGFLDFNNPNSLILEDDPEINRIITEFLEKGGNILELTKMSLQKNIKQKKENNALKKQHEQQNKLIGSLLGQVKELQIEDEFTKKLELLNLDQKPIDSKKVFVKGLKRIKDFQKKQIIKYIKKLRDKAQRDENKEDIDYINNRIGLINSNKIGNERFKLLTEFYKELKEREVKKEKEEIKKESSTFFGKIIKTMGDFLQ